MNREQKEAQVARLKKVFGRAQLVVVTHFSGLDVAEMNELRRSMREAGAEFNVTKNRLTKLALEGSPYGALTDLFSGPTAIAYSDDVLAAAKVAVQYAKDHRNLVIIGGAMGETVLDAGGVAGLAALPSLDALRARIVGLLNAPATRVATVIQAPAAQVARVVGAYGASEGGT